MKKSKFLLDANLSPETAYFLRSLGFDIKSLIEENVGHLEDVEVIGMARREKRILITFDLDFGEMYYFSFRKNFGVIVLRLDDQRIESANEVLVRFLKTPPDVLQKGENCLIVINESEIRIVR